MSRIFFNIDEIADVSLNIYNISGRHIMNLMDCSLNPNAYSIMWNMRDNCNNPVPSGLYFVRLSVNGRTEIGKIAYFK